MIITRIFTACIFLAFSTCSFAGPVDQVITYQGKLEQNGEPVNGNRDFRLFLYSAESGGSQVDSIWVLNNLIVDGVFTIELPFEAAIWNGDERWLEINVRDPLESLNLTTLTPRQKITPAPMAMHALSGGDGDITEVSTDNGLLGGGTSGALTLYADTAYLQRRVFESCPAGASIRLIEDDGEVICETHSGGSTPWSVNGSNAYYSSGFIGVGTSTPVRPLHVHGNTPTLRLSGATQDPLNAGMIEFSESLNDATGSFRITHDGEANKLFFSSKSGNDILNRLTLTRDEGYFGIHTDSPTQPLDVNGIARFRSNGTTNLLLQGGSDNVHIDLSKNSNTTVSARILLDGFTNQAFHQGDIRFWTRANGGSLTERMAIRHTGMVGIGASSPSNVLDVRGSGTTTGGTLEDPYVISRFKNTSSEHSAISVDSVFERDSIIYLSENGKAVWDIRNDSVFGSDEDVFTIRWQEQNPGDTDPLNKGDNNALHIVKSTGGRSFGFEFWFDGDLLPVETSSRNLGTFDNKWNNLYADNGTIQTSDMRAKTDIETLPTGLDAIMRLRPVTYHWKEASDAQRKYGLIAQEVLEVLPEVVHVPEDPDVMMGMNYSELIPVLIKAIQEQQAQINQQSNLISVQQNVLEQILARQQ